MPIMEKHYQILIKGIASGSLKLFETTSYKVYKNFLGTYKESSLYVVITTNIYWIE